jgi:hypothetical protein
MTAKTRAIPSLHRDYFLAEVSGPCRCSRRVTQPPFIAGPLVLMQKIIKQLEHDNLLPLSKLFYPLQDPK